MDVGAVVNLAGQFGALGVLVGYLIYRDSQHEKWRQRHQEERLAADNRESESREKLAVALNSLGHWIQGRGHV